MLKININEQTICFILFFIGVINIKGNILFQEIDKYKRPITVLSLTDNKKFIKKLCKKVSGTCVFYNPDLNVNTIGYPNSIFLCSTYEPKLLRRLGQSEHFDLVYIDSSVRIKTVDMAKILAQLGEFVVIDQPVNDILEQVLLNLNFIQYRCTETKKNYFVFQHKKKFLMRTQWLMPSSKENYRREIISTYETKQQHKNYGENPITTQWLSGINLLTFKMLKGVHPSLDNIQSEIKRLFLTPHMDWVPNNMILQGEKISLIDFEEPDTTEPKAVMTEKLLNLVLSWVSLKDKSKIIKKYHEIYLYNREELNR